MNESTGGGPAGTDDTGTRTVPRCPSSSGRITDYLLGGRTNYAEDRQVAERLLTAWPLARAAARERRVHLRQTLAAHAAAGTVQVLDLGSGMPLGRMYGLLDAHHALAHASPASASTTVYIDIDPDVATHLDALHDPVGGHRVHSREADIRVPGLLPALYQDAVLDPARPVAVVLADVLQEFDDEQVHHLLAALASNLAPGSTLTLTHPSPSPDACARLALVYSSAGIAWHPRTSGQAADLLADWLRSPATDVTEEQGFWAATGTVGRAPRPDHDKGRS